MYEDIVKRLRRCNQFKCRECEYEPVESCRSKLNSEAADAIEDLCGLCASQSKDCSEAISKYLELWEKQPRWIPVTERLPQEKDSGFSADVLILVKEQDGDFTWKDVYSGYYLYDAVSDETGWWAQMPQNCQQIKERFSVTHWMPIPEPPKEEI